MGLAKCSILGKIGFRGLKKTRHKIQKNMFDTKSLHINQTAPGATGWEGRRGYWLDRQRRGLQAESRTGDSGWHCMTVDIS